MTGHPTEAMMQHHRFRLPLDIGTPDEALETLLEEFPFALAGMEATSARGGDPELDGTAAHYDFVLRTIIAQPAERRPGVIAKARFLLLLEGQNDREASADLAWSLARDLVRMEGQREARRTARA